MNKTKIDWCDSTWNPITGCFHGCDYCYARGITERFGLSYTPKLGDPGMEGAGKYDSEMGLDTMLELEKPYRKHGIGKVEPYPAGFEPTFHKYRLNDYIDKKGRNIFVCSMADLFGGWVSDEWIEEVMNACYPQHNYLFLTKNVERYTEYGVPMDKNKWYGTSITKKSDIDRFNYLPAFCNTFVSIEPLLEDLEVEKCGVMFLQVDWFIIGSETGRRKDKVVPDRKWIEDIVNECRKNGKPIFMKSSLADIWGEPLIQEFPEALRRGRRGSGE